jgi:hypothetical protein
MSIDDKSKPAEIFLKVKAFLPQLRRYSLLIFIVFVGAIYGYVVMRINTLSSAEPTQAEISSQVKAAKIPYIDQSIVKQIQSLQDNSVSVQSLFNEARNNPFQE